jgi:hypothetical protein
MIMLNPNFVGMVDRAPSEVISAEKQLGWEVKYTQLLFLSYTLNPSAPHLH